MADVLPTIFDSTSCIAKGLCTVAKNRAPSTHNLYYEIHGVDADDKAAVKLLFIMGEPEAFSLSFAWKHQILHFANKSGYLSLVIDNRGVGNSDTPTGRYSTSEMAKDTEEVLNFVGWTQPKTVVCIGVSMGGMIAQELASLIPERFAALILTSTSAGNVRSEVAPWSSISMFAKLFFVRDENQIARIVLQGLYPQKYLDAEDETDPGHPNFDRLKKELLHRYQITRRQSLRGRLAQTAAAVAHNVSPQRLKRISENVPHVVVITGDQDTIINPARSKDLHDLLPGSEYIVYEGVGHAIPGQCTKEYNTLIERVAGQAKAS